MHTITLIRERSTDQGTPGRLLLPDSRIINIIEPPWRDNERNRSCIPPGQYALVPHASPRFGRCLAVSGVPGRSHILVHAGNVAGDKTAGWHTHSLGCLLPGMRPGKLNLNGRWQQAVLASRTAMRHLLTAITQPAILEISA